MNTNINIPITNEQAIVLSGSTTSSGGCTLDIDYITGRPHQVVGIRNVEPDLTIKFDNETYTHLDGGVFSTINGCISKFVFHKSFEELNDCPIDIYRDESLNFIGFNGTLIFKSLTTIGIRALYGIKNCNLYIPKNLTTIKEEGIQSVGNTTIYYEGTESEWNSITGVENIGGDITMVYNATIPNG